MTRLEETIEILRKLVSFPSVHEWPNGEMIDWLAGFAKPFASQIEVVSDCACANAGIIIKIGEGAADGLVLSGHLDVVPAHPGSFLGDPWKINETQDRLYGRGTADMKGFIACCLAMLRSCSREERSRPIYLVLSHNEETGSQCTPHLIERLKKIADVPELVLVGEPTGLQPVTGHKATFGAVTKIEGRAAHSSDPDMGIDANLAAAYLIMWLRKRQEDAKRVAKLDTHFKPPYTTFNAGTVSGGDARNVVAGEAMLGWECRPMPGEDADAILRAFEHYCESGLVSDTGQATGCYSVNTEKLSHMPGLDPMRHSDRLDAVCAALGLGSPQVVSFATEAGFFQREDWPCLVLGPGSVDQAHKPDEFIEISQLEKCLQLLDRLVKAQLQNATPVAMGM